LKIGIAGVGKDTVAAEVVNDPQVQERKGLQAWLQASSEIVLQQQLVDIFATHRSWVVAGLQDDPQAQIRAIKKWLAECKDWILVFEDASPTSATLWEILPTSNNGRVLVTSQAPLHKDHKEFTGIQLDEILTSDSVSLLLKGGIFTKKKANAADPPLDDATLQRRCVEVGLNFVPLPPKNESPEKSRKRRQNMTEILRPEFVAFLKEELGNLPLSVSMIGEMARSDTSINSTLDLINAFKEVQLDEVWVKAARNNMTDKHYFGLVMSVQITLNRMDSNEDIPLRERREAKALLCALSRLDRAKVPLSLLTGHEMKDLVDRKCEGKCVLQHVINVGVCRAGYQSRLSVFCLTFCSSVFCSTLAFQYATCQKPFRKLSLLIDICELTQNTPSSKCSVSPFRNPHTGPTIVHRYIYRNVPVSFQPP
jgi:hypothetical protein